MVTQGGVSCKPGDLYNPRMLVGIISDTHGRTEAMAAAMQLLQSQGATYFIHCGDVGSGRVLDYLAGLEAGFVWGNCDWDRSALERYARSIGVPCLGRFGEMVLEDKKLGVFHGDDARLKRKLLAEQRHDYLLQGHTHLAEDRRLGRTRLINPGALHRADPKSVAVLDTTTDRVVFLRVGA
jgi:hypothetical protein